MASFNSTAFFGIQKVFLSYRVNKVFESLWVRKQNKTKTKQNTTNKQKRTNKRTNKQTENKQKTSVYQQSTLNSNNK